MKIAGVILIVAAVIILIILILLSRYGLFTSVKITEKSVGPYVLIYSKHIGDYKNVGPVMDKLYNDLNDTYSIETTKGFGLYYDNPREVSKDQLRSIVGCIVEGKTIDELNHLDGKYGVKEYPVSNSVVVEFPFTGKISIIFGVIKVYPKLSEYIIEKNYIHPPIMELYDQPNEIIQYIASPHLSEDVFNGFLE